MALPGSCRKGGEYAGKCLSRFDVFLRHRPQRDRHVGQISEPTDGFYAMNVAQGSFAELKSGHLNPAYVCTLTNQNDDAGPVHVQCIFPALGMTGEADVSNVVVNVTGP